ncbi:MAG: glycine cleavage system protein GcvH [Desulfurococcales archaeon]|nr:glycine cleavage system protein GcvH [Desulfurococcales archaeon]
MAESYKVKAGSIEFTVVKGLLYTETDEWVRLENGKARVGITDYAQKKLTDIVGVELPEPGDEFSKGDPVATLESMKATADVYAPLSGRILEVNERLYEEPELVNKDPYGEGWLFVIEPSNPDEAKELLDDEAYVESVKKREEGH